MIISKEDTSDLNFGPTIISYKEMSTLDGPMMLNNLPLPYEIKVEAQKATEKFDRIMGVKFKMSQTGMCLTMTRTSRGHLESGYYYPTTAFALLSMISHLINPDIVSNFL